MAGLRSLVTEETKNGAAARKIVEKLKDDYPWVAEILGGLEADGSQAEILPGTITIFIHEGKARFSVNVKSVEKTFIGEIGDVLNPWASINCALAMGDVSSKRYSARPASMTKEQESLII